MFKYVMVAERIQMIFERASLAKTNSYYALQASQGGQEDACKGYLAAMKADLDAIKDQWRDMQIAIDIIREKEDEAVE
jgi:hypothetical protein